MVILYLIMLNAMSSIAFINGIDDMMLVKLIISGIICMKKGSFSVLMFLIVLTSTFPSFAKELPESIIIGGEVFIMDKTAGGGRNTATPDNGISMTRSSYEVTDSDVRLYTRDKYNVVSGWVEATAPHFTARAEVWINGRVHATCPNERNQRNIATSTSYRGRVYEDAIPRIFYSFK